MDSDVDLARRAALAGASVAMRHFHALARLPIEEKPDGSVVTEADRETEVAIRTTLHEARPHDAILGEEGGQSGSGTRCWIVDPIDGTSLFLAGDDRWLVLVALVDDGTIVAAVAAVPAQGRIWWASLGEGSYQGSIVDSEVRDAGAISAGIRQPAIIERARLGIVPSVDAITPGELALIAPVRERAVEVRWNTHPALLVASGELDVAIQTRGKVWDFAATALIVTEAGGDVTFLDGPTHPALFTCGSGFREAALNALGRADPKSDAGFRWDSDEVVIA